MRKVILFIVCVVSLLSACAQYVQEDISFPEIRQFLSDEVKEVLK